MTTLTAPAGGEWRRVASTQQQRCTLCGSLVTDVWAYCVATIAHAHVCDGCADTIDNEEAPMTALPTPEQNHEHGLHNGWPHSGCRLCKKSGTAGVTPEVLAEVALALEAAHLDWEQGRATSPDTSDYVLLTEQVLTRTVGPEYLWLADGVTREQVADGLYEAQCDGRLNEWAEMAEWLIAAVTVGPDG